MYGLKLCYEALLIFWILLDGARPEATIETTSSGSDCKCKCVVSAREGDPCRDGSSRETVYIVETIPIGSDCQCSCTAPAPTGCEKRKSDASLRHVFDKDDELDVTSMDTDELHRSLAKLMKVISRVNRILSRHKTKTKISRKDSSSESIMHSDDTSSIERRGNASTETSNETVVVPSLVSTDSKPDYIPADSRNEDSGDNGYADYNESSHDVIIEIPSMDHLGEQKSHIFNVTTAAATTTFVETKPIVTTAGQPMNQSSTDTSIELGEHDDHGRSYKHTLTEFYRSKKKERDRIHESSPMDDDYEEYYEGLDEPVENMESSSTPITVATLSITESSTVQPPGGAQNEFDDRDDTDYIYGPEYYEGNGEFDIASSSTPTTTVSTSTPQQTDPCGTLYRLSRPKIVGSFGRKQGAWMRDSVRSTSDPDRAERIYVTNFYFGDILLQFDNLEKMKRLDYGNTYNLPHKWIGTGHIVYNGSFYFNRAFSTSLIKYDLKSRSVNAWTRLSHAVYQTWVPLDWRGHFLVHLAADEHGLWVIYPARDPSQPQSKLTYIVNRINPEDLSILESYKTKVRQTPSHFFLICGILYSTTGYNSRNARVTDAFDTRTLARRSIYLGIENLYSYTVQFSYNPADRKIYAWDNGRQVEYDVELVY